VNSRAIAAYGTHQTAAEAPGAAQAPAVRRHVSWIKLLLLAALVWLLAMLGYFGGKAASLW
jgi:hypothetical protein